MPAVRRQTPLEKPPVQHYVYDIETYPNIFALGAIHVESGTRYCFEISDRRNQHYELMQWVDWLRLSNCRMVGFNNIGFDYPVVHHIMRGAMDAQSIYRKAMDIINGGRFAHTVWPSDWFVKQVDLFKIHHFDNKAKSTSLKALEFAMRMHSIEDLPHPAGTMLDDQQKNDLIAYMMHDVEATLLFYEHSKSALLFRDQLSGKYGRDFTNHNDTKIGKDYFIMELEKARIPCFDKSSGRKQPRQSPRDNGVCVGDVLLHDTIRFDTPGLQKVHEWFKQFRAFDGDESVPGNLSPHVGGIRLDFGKGGIHGSVDTTCFASDENWTIIDVDVTSYYPSLAIAHRFFPEHLTERFCDIYEDVKQQRLAHKKGTPENAVMKLALNGVYGDSNNVYSPFYDPKYMISITTNGQLMLAMLCEQVAALPGVSLIQANTDGITARVHRTVVDYFHMVCTAWEHQTKMTLEYVQYSRMWVRDVNNYVAEKVDESLKAKGAYVSDVGPGASDPAWHKDHSAVVIPKIATQWLQHGGDVAQMVRSHQDLFDFCCRAKVRRCDQLWWGGDEVQRISRYYVCKQGRELTRRNPLTDHQRKQAFASLEKNKVVVETTPPEKHHLKKYQNACKKVQELSQKLKDNASVSKICAGWKVQLCNDISHATLPIDYDWYVAEVEKLISFARKTP